MFREECGWLKILSWLKIKFFPCLGIQEGAVIFRQVYVIEMSDTCLIHTYSWELLCFGGLAEEEKEQNFTMENWDGDLLSLSANRLCVYMCLYVCVCTYVCMCVYNKEIMTH